MKLSKYIAYLQGNLSKYGDTFEVELWDRGMTARGGAHQHNYDVNFVWREDTTPIPHDIKRVGRDDS